MEEDPHQPIAHSPDCCCIVPLSFRGRPTETEVLFIPINKFVKLIIQYSLLIVLVNLRGISYFPLPNKERDSEL